MNVFLMYKDHDFDLQRKLPSNEQALAQDLELNSLFNAMALDDEFLFKVAKQTVLSGESALDTMVYRQNILKDCLKNPAVVREMYTLALESIDKEKKSFFFILANHPSSILYNSIKFLRIFVDLLKNLRSLAEEHCEKFESEGFTTLLATLKKELSDEYFTIVKNHLDELEFYNGVLISAELGKGNIGSNYLLHRSKNKRQCWIKQIFARKSPAYSFSISNYDQSGARALAELEDKGINLVSNALAQSKDHIHSFFQMLRTEMAFYIGCLNLYEQLARIGEIISFPRPMAASECRHSCIGLYDVCLALTMKQKIIGNDLNADSKNLVFITGANQGGKSTFLRSIGLAQLMMQCGMFVPAESFCSNVCNGLFTHFRREEDTTMSSGKLDEELSRMSNITDNLTSNSMLLFNESFAATNEREGSEIARQITSALLGKSIKVFYVTHLYQLAHGYYDKNMENIIFLRAERQSDGKRTFKIIEGEPLHTSYGKDLYERVFGTDI